MASFTIETRQKESVVDITGHVKRIVAASNVRNGVCTVYVAHATAAITVNENADPAIGGDLLEALRRLVKDGIWQHDRLDGNAAAHIKAAIMGPSESIPIIEGEMALGRWQDIFLCDFDGPRQRRIIVMITEAGQSAMTE